MFQLRGSSTDDALVRNKAIFDRMPDWVMGDSRYTVEMKRYERIASQAVDKYPGFLESQPKQRALLVQHWLKTVKVKQFLNIGPGFGYLEDLTPEYERAALDHCEPFLALLKKEHPDIYCIWGIAEELPFADESLECVVMDSTFQSIVDREKFLCELARVLQPGGRAIFSIAYGWNYPRKHQQGFNVLRAGERELLQHFMREIGLQSSLAYWNMETGEWGSFEASSYLWIYVKKEG